MENQRLTIRAASEKDVPDILLCLASAFESYREEYTAEAYIETTLTAETARARLQAMRVLVADEEAAGIVGTLSWSGLSDGSAHLRGMAVVPGRHGTGIGQMLLEAALREIRDRRFRRVTLDTTSPLRRATRFYRRNGFLPTGVLRDYYGMPLHEYVLDLT
jgi:ribosomal protein S18 acetylase RimI-like enzyme